MLKISNLVTTMIKKKKNGKEEDQMVMPGNGGLTYLLLIRVKQDDCTKDSWIGISIRGRRNSRTRLINLAATHSMESLKFLNSISDDSLHSPKRLQKCKMFHLPMFVIYGRYAGLVLRREGLDFVRYPIQKDIW